MTTLELKLNLPDGLVKQAKGAGLLTPKAIERLLREAIRRKAFDDFLAVADRIEAADVPPLSMEEINAEIKAYRKERRLAGNPR